VTTGLATVAGEPCVMNGFEFSFLGGSMGVAEGARIAAAFSVATAERLPVVCVAASGGSRVQEGTSALVQMQVAAAAIARARGAGIPYIAVAGDPTTGGVWSSLIAGADVVIGTLWDLQRNGIAPYLDRIGLDDWTSRYQEAGFDLVAVGTRSEASARRAEAEMLAATGRPLRGYAGDTPWLDILRDVPDLDVLIVATPDHLHTAPILAALDGLIKNGTYTTILTKWGVQAGAIKTPKINGATS